MLSDFQHYLLAIGNFAKVYRIFWKILLALFKVCFLGLKVKKFLSEILKALHFLLTRFQL